MADAETAVDTENPTVLLAEQDDAAHVEPTETPASDALPDAASVDAEATAAGWVPKERWKGPPERWRPASEFLAARDHVLPVVRKENQTLRSELATLRSELAELKRERDERNEQRSRLSLETLKMERQQAYENNDYQKLAELDAKLVDASVAAAGVKKPASQPEIDPYIAQTVNDFFADNHWDPNGEIAQAIHEEAAFLRHVAKSTLQGKEFLDRAAQRAMRIHPELFPNMNRRPGMAESGGMNGSNRGMTRSWNDLKPEAKQYLETLIEETPGLTREGVLKQAAKNPSEYFRR